MVGRPSHNTVPTSPPLRVLRALRGESPKSARLKLAAPRPTINPRDKYTKGRQALQPLWGETLVGIEVRRSRKHWRSSAAHVPGKLPRAFRRSDHLQRSSRLEGPAAASTKLLTQRKQRASRPASAAQSARTHARHLNTMTAACAQPFGRIRSSAH